MTDIMPDPVTQYAVKARLDDWDGPTLVILTASISDSQAYAERFLDSDGALVSGPSGTDPHTWEVVR